MARGMMKRRIPVLVVAPVRAAVAEAPPDVAAFVPAVVGAAAVHAGDEPAAEGGVGELTVGRLVQAAAEHLQLHDVAHAQGQEGRLGHWVGPGGLAQGRGRSLAV